MRSGKVQENFDQFNEEEREEDDPWGFYTPSEEKGRDATLATWTPCQVDQGPISAFFSGINLTPDPLGDPNE